MENLRRRGTRYIQRRHTRERAVHLSISLRTSLWWPIHIINPVNKTISSSNTPHRHSTTIPLENYRLFRLVGLGVTQQRKTREKEVARFSSLRILRSNFSVHFVFLRLIYGLSEKGTTRSLWMFVLFDNVPFMSLHVLQCELRGWTRLGRTKLSWS